MGQSKAPLYALQEVAKSLQHGQLLVDPRLGPKVESVEYKVEAATCQQ